MDASRQALVDAAVQRFAEVGRDGVGPRDLMRRLGLPPEAVFKHFKNRDAVFAAVAEQVQRELFTYIETHCPVVPGESGLSMILRLAEVYSRFLEERPAPFLDILRGQPGPTAETSASAQELSRIAARIAKQFEVLLLLGGLDGSVRDVAARDTACRIVNVVLGTVRLGLTRPAARERNLRVMLIALVGGQPSSERAA
jgi:AcrR family transcriptional regulator